jgi:hypothetical protein
VRARGVDLRRWGDGDQAGAVGVVGVPPRREQVLPGHAHDEHAGDDGEQPGRSAAHPAASMTHWVTPDVGVGQRWVGKTASCSSPAGWAPAPATAG